jgi:anaerobic ribonucleoside-triphosphate reductase activating protein
VVRDSDLIALNKAYYPVTALGPGRRIGLWLQGCALSCPGCVSRDTWTFAENRSLALSALLSWCQDVASIGLDGVTISGGEPFAQPEALLALLEALQEWRGRKRSNHPSAARHPLLIQGGEFRSVGRSASKVTGRTRTACC